MHFFFICHFISLVWQLGVSVRPLVHDIQASLDVHIDWVVLQMDMESTLIPSRERSFSKNFMQ